MNQRPMRFYGQFEPPVDRVLYMRYFPDHGFRGVFVECGAADGTSESSCRFFEESLGWTGYNLEPEPSFFDQLRSNRPLSRNLNVALSDRNGVARFRHAVHPTLGHNFGNGSLSHTDSHRSYLESIGCEFVSMEVPTLTWRDFVAAEHIAHVDLFVLDVEGHELAVLDGMRGTTVVPDVFCIEVGHLPLPHIRSRLAEFGYVLDTISHVNAFFVRTDRLPLFAWRRQNG